MVEFLGLVLFAGVVYGVYKYVKKSREDKKSGGVGGGSYSKNPQGDDGKDIR